MPTLFGSADRAPLTGPRPHTRTEDLLDTIHRYRHDTVTVVADLARGMVRVTEHDTTTTHPLGALANQMTRARITPAGRDDAFAAWVEHRPVTVTEAATRGHLVLDWVDPAQTTLTWVVAVARTRGALARFTPPLLPAADLARIRTAATERSRALQAQAIDSGAITLLTTTPPALSTGALTRPVQACDPDVLLVVTPGAPVAVGPANAVARLAQETNEAHIVLRPTQVPRT